MKKEIENEAFDRTVLGWYRKGIEEIRNGKIENAKVWCNFLWGACQALYLTDMYPTTQWYVQKLEEELDDAIKNYERQKLPLDYVDSLHQPTEQDGT